MNQSFTLEKSDFTSIGRKLSRPECIIAEPDGTLWVSDNRGGVTRIGKDGRQRLIGSIGGAPNGLAMEQGGSLLVAEIEGGCLYRLQRDGTHEAVLEKFEGSKLRAVNFVHVDGADGAVWITVSTRTEPRSEAVKRPIPDGYVLRLHRGRAILAADGFHFTNEVRIDRERRFLYVAETALGRVVRLPLGREGNLGEREVFGPDGLFPGAVVDGITFDAEGNLWVTELSRNALVMIRPDGSSHAVFEDPAGETLLAPTSLTFGGPDLRTAYVGSLKLDRLMVFRAPVPGAPLAHWRR